MGNTAEAVCRRGDARQKQRTVMKAYTNSASRSGSFRDHTNPTLPQIGEQIRADIAGTLRAEAATFYVLADLKEENEPHHSIYDDSHCEVCRAETQGGHKTFRLRAIEVPGEPDRRQNDQDCRNEKDTSYGLPKGPSQLA